ncbi:AMP-binding protein [Amycolatopsis thermoflava]|uniref:AMP-binding protein n=1 Tax=Amycolatopsis thermoflava TaxID=84480 RepID=UPI000412A48C|nr:AMP-binding protein [Amycolatopsis thermoflava]
MEPWRAILDGLPDNARVVLRCPTGDAFAELLLACADRRLVAVPLRARVPDTEVARVAAAVGASAVVDGPPRVSRVSLLDGEPGHPDAAGLAFLVHTPGAGRCVMLGRDEVAGNAARTAALHGFSPVRPHATALPLHHVTALVMSLVGTRLTDAPLVLTERFDPVTFFAAVEAEGAQTASLVPAQLRDVVRAGVHWPDCLEYVITSGAPLSRELAADFAARYGPRLRQAYGLTEAVNLSTTMPLLDAAGFREQYVRHQGPVGVPLPGTELRLEDGEVWLRAPELMRGYWGAPEASPVTPDGWLRTGDRGDLRDGFLVLHGRSAELIERGGQRLHPADVEGEWRAAGLSGEFAAVAVPEPALGHEVALVGAVAGLRGVCRTARVRPAVFSSSGFLAAENGQPLRDAMARGLTVRRESALRYEELLDHACRAARAILASPVRPECARARHVYREALALTAAHSPPRQALPGTRTAAHDALDALVVAWPALAEGAPFEEWRRVPADWPMSVYAEYAAEVVIASGRTRGRVLDAGPDDLDSGPGPEMFDTIVATNTVHRAADKEMALRRLRDMLTDGGRLVLAEGTSPTAGATPWALDLLFAAVDGWWDRGGLRGRWEWLRLLRDAGFREPGYAALHAGHHDLGGVVWATK